MEADFTDIVVSLKGRDMGKHFYAVGREDVYLFLADGKGRKIDNPKKKKCKHVRRVSEGGYIAQKLRNGDRVTNSELRQALSEVNSAACGAEVC